MSEQTKYPSHFGDLVTLRSFIHHMTERGEKKRKNIERIRGKLEYRDLYKEEPI